MVKILVSLDEGAMMMTMMKIMTIMMMTLTTTSGREEGDTVNPKKGRGRKTTMTRATRIETGGV